MLTFDEALKIIRKNFPNDYVLSGFEYRNFYVFNLFSKDYKKMYTDQSVKMTVDKKTGETTYLDMHAVFYDLDAYSKAMDSTKHLIDRMEEE